MRDVRLRYLIDGRTIGGRRIFLDGAHEQNWIRSALSLVQSHLTGISDASAADDEARWFEAMNAAIAVCDSLRENLTNPVHFGDNKPGLFDIRGRSVLPDRVFTYFDLWQFGVTAADGFAGFIRDCGMPTDTAPAPVLRAAGFLLVDDAVSALQGGRDAFAGSLMYQAQELALEATLLAWEEMTPVKVKQAIAARLSEAGRLAGLRSGRARRKASKVNPKEVHEEASKLRAQGRDPRSISALLGERLGVTGDYIRRIRKKPA